ncbi:hypothetical protein BpHYR1_006180 [Brachionus plicatilis]|uniref:Uncharacterized protein n=1 Tax=Brachionus plicatilis TaxID=10195 RepID=A0A3M7PX21_BRAPC|nr:hypothetical protein BpHYR1_006180 [Brachionus plicatilis]
MKHPIKINHQICADKNYDVKIKIFYLHLIKNFVDLKFGLEIKKHFMIKTNKIQINEILFAYDPFNEHMYH